MNYLWQINQPALRYKQLTVAARKIHALLIIKQINAKTTKKYLKKKIRDSAKNNKTYLNIPHLVWALAFLPEQFVLQVDRFLSIPVFVDRAVRNMLPDTVCVFKGSVAAY